MGTARVAARSGDSRRTPIDGELAVSSCDDVIRSYTSYGEADRLRHGASEQEAVGTTASPPAPVSGQGLVNRRCRAAGNGRAR